MKEYIKKFDENTSGYDYNINDIPWIATVKTTNQNLFTNRNYCMTIQNNDRLKVVRKTVVKRSTGVIDILDIRGTITSSSISDISNITELEIGDAVTSIGDNVFYNFTNLVSVMIGNSVTSIGWGAFNACSYLTSVTIPDSVKNISAVAFCNCI